MSEVQTEATTLRDQLTQGSMWRMKASVQLFCRNGRRHHAARNNMTKLSFMRGSVFRVLEEPSRVRPEDTECVTAAFLPGSERGIHRISVRSLDGLIEPVKE